MKHAADHDHWESGCSNVLSAGTGVKHKGKVELK